MCRYHLLAGLRLTICFGFLFSSAGVRAAAPATKGGETKGGETKGSTFQVEESLSEIESRWARSVETSATPEIAQLLTDDFLFVDASGTLKGAKEYLKELDSGAIRVESCAIEHLTIRVAGESAVVSASVGLMAQNGQHDISGFYRVTDAFIRRDGKWRAVSRQQTRIASRKDPLFERLGKPNGKPRIVVFVQGSFCPHCMTQLVTFAKELSDRKYEVTVVSADTDDDLKKFPAVPFHLVADPQHKLFRRFGAFKEKPLHATLAFDQRGTLVFSTVGESPFMNTDVVALWMDKAAAADVVRSSQSAGR